MGKIDNKDKDFFNILVRGLKSSGMKQSNLESFDGDLLTKLQDAYDTISKLEHKNQSLMRHLIMLKSTYEFFDYSNDHRVMNNI